MPYQGGYVPQYYGGNHTSGRQQQQQHQNHQNGQARQPEYHQMQQQTYQQPSLQTHTPYATPQYFDQGRASYYQTPTSGTYNQQPYLSPPSQSATQNLQYSPDPLHRFQAPPQPRQPEQPQQQAYHQQPQQRQAQRPGSQSSQTPQAFRPHSSQRQQPADSPQWPKTPWSPSPYETSALNAHSAATNSQVLTQPQQTVQQNPRTQRQHSQASQGYASSPSEFRRPSPVQRQQSQARPSHQVMPSQDYKQVQASQQIAPHRHESHQKQSQPLQAQHAPHRSMSNQAAATMGNQNLTAQPAMLQRQPSAVRASMSSTAVKLEEPSHIRSPKRRRSNDGTVVLICKSPEPKAHGSSSQYIKPEPGLVENDQFRQIKHPPPVSSPLTDLASSQMPPMPTPRISIDYQSALLALSDDYISAAYNLTGSLSSAEVSDELLDQYQSLLATGMGCLDSVLKNYRNSDARKEARIRLRYASLLYEETENLTDAEECLSKGITLCERAHLTDLKYAMHHLTARIWFKSRKFKTAMKTVERLSAEAEKLQLLHWVYAFYFLRISFGLQISDNHHETVSLVRHLTALSAIAKSHYHGSVQILALTLEALVHLRARTPDSVDLASRAIASARMHQLTPEMTGMPQVRILLDCMDVACSLVRFDRKQADVKLHDMHAQMDSSTIDAAWVNSHGCALHIDLGGHSIDVEVEADSGGIFELCPNGDTSLAFSWLTKGQAYIVGYLVTGLSKLDGSRANEALKYLDQALTSSKRDPKDMALSQSAASSRRQIQISLRATARLYVAFAFCGASMWDQAKRAMDAYKNTDLPLLEGKPDATTVTLATYLDGLISHAQGELDSALEIYRSTPLQVKLAGNMKGDTMPVDPTKILAALNSIEILQLKGKHKEADLLLEWAEPYCRVIINNIGNDHGSRAFDALLNILKAAACHRSGGLIIETKALLQKSTTAAQTINNVQLLMVIMTMMTELYFKNIVGQQALNSGKASSGLANKSGNKLWSAMANGMYADTIELCGHKPQAEEMRNQAQHHMRSLPDKVLEALQKGKN